MYINYATNSLYVPLQLEYAFPICTRMQLNLATLLVFFHSCFVISLCFSLFRPSGHSHKSVDDYSDLSTLIKYATINRANTIRLLVIGENEVKILSSGDFLLTAVWRLKTNLLWYILR